MTENPNATRESIKDFILGWQTEDKPLHLKRSGKMHPPPSTAVVQGYPSREYGLSLRGSNGDVLTYRDLDALLDDGWLID
jgi:hypothetical protein